MPVSSAQLLAGANTQRETFATGDPIDQINAERPTLQWLIANKVDSVFGNGIFNEKVRISNDSNYQRYTGDDQVTYNRKDTIRKAPYQHYEVHDGFLLNETELANNGVVMTDDNNSVPTDAEVIQIVNLLREGQATLKLGLQQNLDLDVHRDGSQSAKAVPGLDTLVSTTPTVSTTVGGLDPSVSTFWANNADMAISVATAGNLQSEMDKMTRACMQFGGMTPDFYPCGSKFYDAYKADCLKTSTQMLSVDGKGGLDVGGGVTGLFYNKKPVVWDPTFDALDALLGSITYPWAKRLYMLQSKVLKLRPFKGRWMINRTPARMYDRYTNYFATTADFGMTTKQRNCMAVLSIA